MAGTSSSTTVKVTKQQLFSFLAVHARMPPGDPLLKKQNYAAFEDGVAFCRMFNCVFVQRTIAPIATSHQTSSTSGRSARNWKALYRAMNSIGIPAQSILPRELYRSGCGDSVGAYSGLVFFYFMFHLAKRTDFSAEFNADVSESLSAFLQSMDSIRALVLGGALPHDGIPTEMLPYCTTAVVVADDAPLVRSASVMSSVDEVDCTSDVGGVALGSLAVQGGGRRHGDELPRQGEIDRPLLYDPTPQQSVGLNNTAPVRTLFPDEATLEEKTPHAQRLPVPRVTEMYEVSPPSGGVPRPHATSPRLLQRAARPWCSSNVQGGSTPGRDGSHQAELATGVTQPATEVVTGSASYLDAHAQMEHAVPPSATGNNAHDSQPIGGAPLSTIEDDTIDVDAEAAALQRQLLRACADPSLADAAQATLWHILCAYHTTRDRWHQAEVRLREASGERLTWEEALRDAQRAQHVAEANLAAKSVECGQLRADLVASERDAEAAAASHRQTIQSLHDNHIRLRQDYEQVLAAPNAQLAVRCSLLMSLCATLRDLDATSMELTVAVNDHAEVDDDTAAAVVARLLHQRQELQAAAADAVEKLKRVDGQSPQSKRIAQETSSDTGAEGEGEVEGLSNNTMVQTALEERIRSVTVSRDQLLTELQRLTEDAAVWCNEVTDLRQQKREWNSRVDHQESLQAELDRRDEIIEDLRRKLGVAMGELDHLSRSAQRRQREQSSIWSIPPPTLSKEAPSSGRSGGSPAAQSPNAVNGSVHEVGVPIFRLSSPRVVQHPIDVHAMPSPADIEGRAQTEARVLDVWTSPMPHHTGAEDNATTYKHASGPALSCALSLRDLEAADVLDHRGATVGPY